MESLETTLGNIVMAPYIVKAMALIGVKRRTGSNMFRHQISTMGILLDYKVADPVLLKAALIHDLFEDAAGMPGVTEDEITRIDADGRAVYDLVMEVTLRDAGGAKEPKPQFLSRIMQHGSRRAKVLKLADRISNLTALGFVHDRAVRQAISGRDEGIRAPLRQAGQPRHVPRAVRPDREPRAAPHPPQRTLNRGPVSCQDGVSSDSTRTTASAVSTAGTTIAA